jgi:hypothetical protein
VDICSHGLLANLPRCLLREMTTEVAGRGEFAQFMTNHVFSDIDRNMPAAIMYSDGVANHLGEDGAGPAPGTNNFLFALGIHYFDLLQKFGLNERPFFQRS